MRILVVDDDAVMRKVFLVMLQRADFTVDVTRDVLIGVEMWEKENYDLVLMDVQMPRMNGFEATGAIREKERACGRHTPVIAITVMLLRKMKRNALPKVWMPIFPNR